MNTSMQARKSVVTPLVPPKLREADVVLSRGIGWLSDLIARVDGGDYSHAAFYDGEMFIQATKKGVLRMKPEILPADQEFLDCYRFQTRDGRILGRDPGELSPQPPIDEATKMIGLPFAYGDLFAALRMLHVRRNSPADWDESWPKKLRKEMKNYRKGGSEAKLTCTELVTRAFWNSTQSGTIPDYAIWVKFERPPKFGPPRGNDYLELLDETAEFLHHEDPHFSVQAAALSHQIPEGPKRKEVEAGSTDLLAQYVTPFDLQTSSSMTAKGRISPYT